MACYHRPMRRAIFRVVFLLLLLFLSLPLSSQANDPQSFTGKVVGISDGDTISVMCGDWVVIVRLYGIDCPKLGQPFGKWAEKFTSNLTLGKEVEVRVRDTDMYGRIIGEVILPNGKNLSHELVMVGMAWWDRKHFPTYSILGALEWLAQVGRLGLWVDENCVPPWEWGQGNRRPSEFRDI
jgi:micrococcal nuclease